mmetsp:Transcript_50475/g.157610  ORF Transcript_50475/g.157610 Transcript_50475/m.157610 type:complete len:89 (-) Transcript_50475:734-1000(-)
MPVKIPKTAHAIAEVNTAITFPNADLSLTRGNSPNKLQRVKYEELAMLVKRPSIAGLFLSAIQFAPDKMIHTADPTNPDLNIKTLFSR